MGAMKVFLDSIGCRLNQSEIRSIAQQLIGRGHEIVADASMADKVILNTCAVTREAAREARKRTRRFHRQNQDADILLTGCYATIAPEDLAILPGVSQVTPNKAKMQLARIIDPTAQGEIPLFDQEPILREMLAGQMGTTRAFVKVQDGCDNKCTFCITTVARGAGVSRPLGDIIAEIQALAGAGYQEAVLTGVHLGSYGHDLGNTAGLRDLVSAILRHTDMPRLRLSSLEPWDIAPDFFALWQDSRLLPHLHLPLQSGSDRILKKMARKTRRAPFRELVHAARAQAPALNLSTDLITGFPGESAADHETTMDFVLEMAFSRLHVFTYSARPGTAAASMPDHLPPKVKKARTKALISLGRSLSHAFHQQFEETTRLVLWETAVGADDQGLRWSGYTDNYIRVAGHSPQDLFNQITPALLVNARPDGMAARPLFSATAPLQHEEHG